jgi:predicted dinucleotide-binding enzyme
VRPEFTDPTISTSELVQQFLSGSRVIKAFSHIGYHDLHDETRPEGAPDRKAVAIAGDNDDDLNIVSKLVNDLGFDPVLIGPLPTGIKLQPGGPVFGAHVSVAELSTSLDAMRTHVYPAVK